MILGPLLFRERIKVGRERGREREVRGTYISLASLSHCHVFNRSLAKSWFTLAGWSYKKGRKVVDSVLSSAPDPDAAAASTSTAATAPSLSKTQREADRQTFLALLPTSWMTQEEIDASLDVLDHVSSMYVCVHVHAGVSGMQVG